MENSTQDSLTDLQVNGTEDGFKQDVFLLILREIQVEAIFGTHYEAKIHAISFFFVLGLVTNVLNVAVLSRTSSRSSLKLLLIALSVSDALHLVHQFVQAVHYYAGFKLYPQFDWVIFQNASIFLEGVFLCACAWLLVAIGIWRFLMVKWPLRSQEYCSHYKAKLTIFLIYVSSVLLSCTSFLVNTYATLHYKGLVIYEVEHSPLVKANGELGLKIIFSIQLLKGVVPMLVILIMTTALIIILYRMRIQRKKCLNLSTDTVESHKITVMLVVLLLLYFLSNFVDSFAFFIRICCPDALDEYITKLDNLSFLSLVSNSTTFFIYYGLGADFRKTTHELICCSCSRRCPRTTEQDNEMEVKAGDSQASNCSSTSFASSSASKHEAKSVEAVSEL